MDGEGVTTIIKAIIGRNTTIFLSFWTVLNSKREVDLMYSRDFSFRLFQKGHRAVGHVGVTHWHKTFLTKGKRGLYIFDARHYICYNVVLGSYCICRV